MEGIKTDKKFTAKSPFSDTIIAYDGSSYPYTRPLGETKKSLAEMKASLDLSDISVPEFPSLVGLSEQHLPTSILAKK